MLGGAQRQGRIGKVCCDVRILQVRIFPDGSGGSLRLCLGGGSECAVNEETERDPKLEDTGGVRKALANGVSSDGRRRIETRPHVESRNSIHIRWGEPWICET